MSENAISLRFKGEETSDSGSRCSVCGEPFETPLLAMVFSELVTEEYYACPRCLSKAANFCTKPELDETEALEDNFFEHGAVEISVGGSVEKPECCEHHLGYLKNRIKTSSMPEECLTCSKIIECMY